MSSIPGAHASLGFGRKRVDFYASPGVTAGEGQRRGEHEIRDADGASHSMRLSRPDTPLETGETVTVLRAQSGPDHGSRPVAVINHDRNAWTRTAPEATAVLARSGITRATNWWLTMLLFMVAAIAFSWSDIRLFMLEVDPGMFASIPAFNIFELVAARIPVLAGFDLAAVIPGFTGLVEQLGLPGWLSPQTLAFALPLTFLALLTYLARSWRIIWAPVYVFAAIATGLALGAESPLTPAILALAGVGLVFCVGGFINRTRDAGRLEGRIARLSENILRHPPAETVAAPSAAGAALAAAAIVGAPEAGEVEDEAADDLPSDEELAAARSVSDDADPAPVPSMPATAEHASVEDTSTSDRDMVMPPPPPLANRSVSDTAVSGEAGVTETETAATDETDVPVTAAASAMHAPTPEPVETQADSQSPAGTPSPQESDIADTPATATASAMQAPTPEAMPAAPAIEPAPDTPAAEDVHSFAASGSASGERLMSSRDITDAEDAADAADAPDAAPMASASTPANAEADGDEVSDPFMSPEPETPRQTDS